ncbi:hypothetical protein NCPPB3923_05455 [Burkholderia glumae]|nr:hypothetical protein NCPPB3923_05455 [Burkholderia glumae]
MGRQHVRDCIDTQECPERRIQEMCGPEAIDEGRMSGSEAFIRSRNQWFDFQRLLCRIRFAHSLCPQLYRCACGWYPPRIAFQIPQIAGEKIP